MARVAIIDDEGVFRVGLRDVLNSTPGVNVIGDGPDSSRVTLDADVLVIAEMSGLWRHLVTDHNLSSQSRAFVVILDAPDDVTLARARELGVASCVPRSATPEAFVRAIKHAVRLVKSPVGNEHVEPDRAMPAPVQSFSTARELPQDGVEADGATDTNGSPDTVPMSPLGARDVEILACVAAGFSNRQVGDRLGVSDQTVKNRLTSILRKIGAADRTEAVVTAIRYRWLTIEQIPGRVVGGEIAT